MNHSACIASNQRVRLLRQTLSTEPALRADLRALGVARVDGEYDSSGEREIAVRLRCFKALHFGAWVRLPDPLRVKVANLLYAVVELRHPGWETVDGARGEFRWNLVDGSLENEHIDRLVQYRRFLHSGFGPDVAANTGADGPTPSKSASRLVR